MWDKAARALSQSDTWLVIGYSFPTYDETVNGLMSANANHCTHVHILNPDPTVTVRVKNLLPSATVSGHPGIPQRIDDVATDLGWVSENGCLAEGQK